MREKYIEQKLVREVKKLGGLCEKWNSGSSGWPDRLVLLPDGKFGLVEVKASGKKPRVLQEHRHDQLRSGVRITMAENIPVKGTEDEKKKAYQKQANKRYKQMQYVYKQLEKFARVIMGGDFNNYRRRTELKDWNIGRILCDNQEYKIYTPKGQSIKEKKSIRGEEYEFAEDHFVTKNCEIDNEVYDRCFVFRDEKYINGEDLSDWNYLSGYPDHAILIADLLL